MVNYSRQRLLTGFVTAFVLALLGTMEAPAQQLDTASVIKEVDVAVKARIDNIVGYTANEHYAVYRHEDEVHPVAEMTVATTYKEATGKSYRIVQRSGSKIIQKLVLNAILDNEVHLNLPGVRESAWITSANYEMKLKPGGIQSLNGRSCLVLTLNPRRSEPYLIKGTLWVDSTDDSIIQVQGITSKSSSFVTGPTQVLRQYANVGGFSQAKHLRAVSNSFLFGQTIVKIDYQDYQIQLYQHR